MTGRIYLDNNATTRVCPECADAVLACLREDFGNPGSKHGFGARAGARVREARAQVARLLNAQPAEIVFTSGGTEANHLAIQGALALSGKRHVVTSAVEHPSTLALLRHLEAWGLEVSWVPVARDGTLDLPALKRAITPTTALVSLMWANNETGIVFPVEEAATLAHACGALFHTDAVQAAGRAEIDVARLPVDLLSLSGHKLHAPKGIGALFVRKGVKLQPQFFGQQERGRRGGTENVPGIVGLGVASGLAAERLRETSAGVGRLRDRLEQGVLARVPGAQVNGGGGRVASTTNIRFGTLDAEAILHKLDQAGIAASAGAACSAGGNEPSHVLTAMGLSRAEALASIRFSLSGDNTAEEIERVLEVLPGIIHALARAA